MMNDVVGKQLPSRSALFSYNSKVWSVLFCIYHSDLPMVTMVNLLTYKTHILTVYLDLTLWNV